MRSMNSTTQTTKTITAQKATEAGTYDMAPHARLTIEAGTAVEIIRHPSFGHTTIARLADGQLIAIDNRYLSSRS